MSAALTWIRLSFRLQRVEILLLGLAVVLASALMLWSAFQLDGLRAAYPDCNWFDPVRACQAPAQRFLEAYGSAELMMNNTWLAGFGLGVVLGVPLVAREIDHGTAQLAWTIGRSRVRWLVGRVAFAILIAIVLLTVLAVVTEILASAMAVDFDPSEAFWLYGGRGPLVVGRGLIALGVGVLVGAMLGRQLPALLLSVIAIGLLYAGSRLAFERWYVTEAVMASQNEWLGSPLFLESGIQLASGERVSWGEWISTSTDVGPWMGEDGSLYGSEADADAERNPIGREYSLIIPGERYNEIVVREAAVLAAAGLILVGAAAAVVLRRRPT